MMVRISSRRSGATSQATVACPASWVAISRPLVLGVGDRLSEPDLDLHPGVLDVAPTTCAARVSRTAWISASSSRPSSIAGL